MTTMTTRQLAEQGWTAKRVARAIRRGSLIRVRRGHFATPDTDPDVVRAVEIGGRLGCVSELRFLGVWVPEVTAIHVHLAPNAARLRSVEGAVLHWSVLLADPGSGSSHVSVIDALAAACGCLDAWGAIAVMESAVNRGVLSLAELRGGLVVASARVRALVARVEPTAESGLETIVRLLVIALGFRVAAQVRYPGIGVVDLVVEGWIVIETDGSHHDEPVVSARDRRRDARHAAAGRTPLRFRYHQVMSDLPSVAAAIIGAVRSHRRVRNSGELARKAEMRLKRLDIS
jgi:very-short-patch-repair endonuclease